MKGQISAFNDEIEQSLTDIDRLKAAIGALDDDEEDDVIVFSPGASRKRPSRTAAEAARKRLRALDGSDFEDTDST